MPQVSELILVYDGECPFCNHYCHWVKLKASVGSLILVDARHPSAVRAEISALNIALDRGMVLKMGGRFYCGAEALRQLSLLCDDKYFTLRMQRQLFASKAVSRLVYPVLRTCRNGALWLLDIPKINNLLPGGERE